MRLRQIYAANVHLWKPRTLWANLTIKGKRAPYSRILLFGRCRIQADRTARIGIAAGHLVLNRYIRRADPFIGNVELYENACINVKGTFFFHSGCDVMVFKGAELNLGSGYINRYARIRCHQRISIGTDVAISEGVTIWDSDAHHIEGTPENTLPVSIGNHVWIGTNVTILKGVTIGDGAVIAAGSLVNRDIPAHCLAAGVPAKVVKERVVWTK